MFFHTRDSYSNAFILQCTSALQALGDNEQFNLPSLENQNIYRTLQGVGAQGDTGSQMDRGIPMSPATLLPSTCSLVSYFTLAWLN